MRAEEARKLSRVPIPELNNIIQRIKSAATSGKTSIKLTYSATFGPQPISNRHIKLLEGLGYAVIKGSCGFGFLYIEVSW